MHSPISICIFAPLNSLAQVVTETLSHSDRYLINHYASLSPFCQFVEKEKHHLDCIMLQASAELGQLTTWLYGRAILLPAVILVDPTAPPTASTASEVLPEALPAAPAEAFSYHLAEVILPTTDLTEVGQAINQAIAQFINLSPTSWVKPSAAPPPTQDSPSPLDLLLPQQRRLAEKLKERLGYLGVYYKRDPQNFFRHLSPEEKQELLDTLKATYREIVLRYFTDDGTLNQRIDDFVNTAFFTDVSAAQIVEIHMELIDDFSKQLKLEGRSEEILLDYRLTLIDTISHLCEMYRRSIPRET
ncbi:MAG: circadian clock protein KaiA [Leptolyngbyaceae cyanobacterium bins.349]|nr:circadian clock protein KaiA [Leptolyngbyaceae cyanobacterium bins.349]